MGIRGSCLVCRRLASTAWVGLAGVLAAGRAHGEAPPIEYRAPTECPKAGAFAAQVAARTAAYLAAADDLALEVEIEARAGAVHGRMVLERGGQRTVREIKGERCTDVVAALALITAILLDPDADTRPLRQPAAQETWHLEPAAPPARRPRHPRASRARWQALLGTQIGVSAAVAPSLVLGPRWFAGLTRPSDDHWLSSMRLSASRAQSETTRHGADGATATFTLSTLRADGCVLRFGGPEVSAEPCLFFEGGILRASGSHPTVSRSERMAWFSLGALARGSWILWDILVLEGDAGLLTPLKTYRTEFGADIRVYETPPIGFVASLGMAVRFR